MRDAIHITDLEAAINHWRARQPATGAALAPEVAALAEVYARMVFHRQHQADAAHLPAAARSAWLAWYATTPDAPGSSPRAAARSPCAQLTCDIIAL